MRASVCVPVGVVGEGGMVVRGGGGGAVGGLRVCLCACERLREGASERWGENAQHANQRRTLPTHGERHGAFSNIMLLQAFPLKEKHT